MKRDISVEAVGEIVLVEKSLVLFECDGKAVQHVVHVGLGEERRVLKLRLVGVEVVVVLDCLHDVAELQRFQ